MWEISADGTTITAQVQANPGQEFVKPHKALMVSAGFKARQTLRILMCLRAQWQAYNYKARDFRWIVCANPLNASCLNPIGKGIGASS